MWKSVLRFFSGPAHKQTSLRFIFFFFGRESQIIFKVEAKSARKGAQRTPLSIFAFSRRFRFGRTPKLSPLSPLGQGPGQAVIAAPGTNFQ